jgi:hypothetical protein
MSIVMDVWPGRDNSYLLFLEATDKAGTRLPANLDSAASMMLELEDSVTISVSRNDAGAPINWWDVDLDEGEVLFTLGSQVDAVEEGNYPARLTLYSLSAPNGIVWTSFARNEMSISVHESDVSDLVPVSPPIEYLVNNVGDQLTDDEDNLLTV